VFLTEKLKFGWDQVHDIAEQLEHVKGAELISRLDHYLGHPRFDPHGDPIPDSNGQLDAVRARPLSRFRKKGKYVFMGVAEHSTGFLQYLTSLGLKIGDTIRVEEVNGFDNSLSVKLNKRSFFLSEKVGASILVEEKK
jgi:DtxR family transcriptional regulator, Mn-dependent transcriptional regulator